MSQEKADIITDLTKNGFDVEDMSDDDIAKTHVRYLMGGRAANDNERLYTFEFPEQKGALLKFLETLQIVGIFHYSTIVPTARTMEISLLVSKLKKANKQNLNRHLLNSIMFLKM